MNPLSQVLVVDRLSARDRESICQDISFSVPAGSIHSLLGVEGSGKAAIVACILGERRPTSGHVWISGRDAWTDRRLLSGWVEAVTPEVRIRRSATVRRMSTRRARLSERWNEKGLNQRLLRLGVPLDRPWQELTPALRVAALFALAVAGSPRLVILRVTDSWFADAGARDAWIQEVREVAFSGVSVLIPAPRADDVADLADDISILRSGKLVLSGRTVALKSSFRRIRYRNEITPEREEYGNELEGFDAAQVRVRGWGVEAVVTNFSDSLYERFRRTPGVVDAQASPMSLAEIFETVAKPRRADPSSP